MKVVSSLKRLCKDCYVVRRGKKLYLRCKTSPRHKRRQGFSTLNYLAPVDSPEELQAMSKSYDGFYVDSVFQADCSRCAKKSTGSEASTNQTPEQRTAGQTILAQPFSFMHIGASIKAKQNFLEMSDDADIDSNNTQ